MRISIIKTNQTLKYIHGVLNVSEHPTAAVIYNVPKHLKKKVINENYTQGSLQMLSDDISQYLGLKYSIKVTPKHENTDYASVDVKTLLESDKAGLYTVINGRHREIEINIKYKFKFKHILAILVHESLHNYLDHRNIRNNNTVENEILTDLSAVYLGFGKILYIGYKKMKRQSISSKSVVNVTTMHHKQLGYVSSNMIKYAVFRTALLRNEKQFIKLSSILYKLPLYLIFFIRKIRDRRSVVGSSFAKASADKNQ